MKTIYCLFLFSVTVISAWTQDLKFYEFDFHGDYPDSLNMIAATSDEKLIANIESQLSLPEEERTKHINGKIAGGTETNNPEYSWHFISNEWSLVEISIEVCDGRPYEDVEQDTTYWIHTVGRFCPWDSYVLREVEPVGIKSTDLNNSIRIFNDLVNQLVMIENSNRIPIDFVRVYSSSGKVVEVMAGPFPDSFSLNFSQQSQGLFYICIRAEKEFIVKKVLVE
jgi:hypothetical protein